MPKGDKLPVKQALFVKYYLIERNATKAYIKAWYSAKTANEGSSRLLANVRIKALIDEGLKELTSKLDFDWIRVLNNLKEVAERCMQKVPVMYFDKVDKEYKQKKERGVNPETGEGEYMWVRTFDSSWANTALTNLGRHFKLFTDKTENENNNKNIEEPSDADIEEATN